MGIEKVRLLFSGEFGENTITSHGTDLNLIGNGAKQLCISFEKDLGVKEWVEKAEDTGRRSY